MHCEVLLPSLGDEDDAVQGGKIAFWLAEEGEFLDEDEDLLELTTDKASFVVPCPRPGTLAKKCAAEGAEVLVGDLLCILDVEEE